MSRSFCKTGRWGAGHSAISACRSPYHCNRASWLLGASTKFFSTSGRSILIFYTGSVVPSQRTSESNVDGLSPAVGLLRIQPTVQLSATLHPSGKLVPLDRAEGDAVARPEHSPHPLRLLLARALHHSHNSAGRGRALDLNPPLAASEFCIGRSHEPTTIQTPKRGKR